MGVQEINSGRKKLTKLRDEFLPLLMNGQVLANYDLRSDVGQVFVQTYPTSLLLY